jgi:leucyl aminopeptidase (aminopeptidase T)
MSSEELIQLNVAGARSIVRDYLKLKRGEFFLIICDETTCEIANYVKPEAIDMGAEVEIIQISTDSQAKVTNRDTFPSELAESIREAQCILNVLAGIPECTEFRIQIIRIGQKFGTRIAHAPGLKTEYLRTAFQADFDEMLRWNNIFFRFLYFAKDCTVITKDRQGNSYELYLKLGGTERLPAQSAEVRDGSWTNIPGAEVYIAPVEELTYGDIIINGSMLSDVLKNDVLIRFKNGKIESWQSMDEQFQKVLGTFSEEWKHDPKWNILCEFGIGLNNAFKKVTGSQLLDEKMRGTCHIAVGNNKEFGGKIDSRIHQDFVTIKPTNIIDGKKIMVEGEFKIDESDVYEDLAQLSVTEEAFVGKRYRLTVREMDEQDGKAGLDLRDGTDQPFFFQIGNDSTAQMMLKVMKKLESTPEFSYEKIKSSFEQTPAILTLLLKYDFIETIETIEGEDDH